MGIMKTLIKGINKNTEKETIKTKMKEQNPKQQKENKMAGLPPKKKDDGSLNNAKTRRDWMKREEIKNGLELVI